MFDLEPTQKEIDGILFEYRPLLATPARGLLNKLIGKFGPALAGAIEELKKAGDFDMDADVSELPMLFGDALGALVREISLGADANFHNGVVDLLRKQSSAQNTDGNMQPLGTGTGVNMYAEQLFAVHQLRELKWIAFCLEVQFSDFLGGLREAGSALMATKATKAAQKSDSPKG
jgi:hypothetical protein